MTAPKVLPQRERVEKAPSTQQMRAQIRRLLSPYVSGPAFQPDDQDPPSLKVVGKWGEIGRFPDGTWDVWLHTEEGLGTKKLNNMLAKVPASIKPVVLTGEAFFQTEDTEAVVAFLPVLGVAKKRHMSEEQKAINAKRLASLRKEKD